MQFNEALERAKAQLAPSARSVAESQLQALVSSLASSTPAAPAPGIMERFAVRAEGSLQIVKTADVDYWETAGNYLCAHIGSRKHLVRMSAKQLEGRIDPRQFVRIHRRFIVKIERGVEVEPWFAGDGVVVLRDRTKLRLSRSFREAFHSRLLGSR